MGQVIIKRRYRGIGLQIEGLLYSGIFKAGGCLPLKRELSERFNTSRTAIREVVIMLGLKSILNVKQGSGVFLVDSADKFDQKSSVPYSETGLFEPLQVRQVIENNIAGSAASQINFNELQELKKIVRLQEEAVAAESDKFEDLDYRFHSITTEATQGRILIKQVAELWRTVRTENPHWKKPNYKCLHEKHLRLQWLEDHRAIFLVLQQKDSGLAREASRRHLENSKNELIKIFRQDASVSDSDDFLFAR